MHVVWIAPFWPWPPTTGAHLRVGGMVTGLAGRGVDVTYLGPAEATPVDPPEGVQCIAALRSGHHRNTRIRNLIERRALDSCLPIADQLAVIDWSSVRAVVATQPFMAPVLKHVDPRVPVLLDAHNIEAELATAKATHGFSPHQVIDRLEVSRIATAESTAVERADLVICPSDRDAAALGRKAVVVPSGSDPSQPPRPPRATHDPEVLMVGHLGFAPNVDAVDWLVDEIEPALHQRLPALQLTIAGRTPTAGVRAKCASNPRVRLVADATDIDALYRNADLAIVPLRSGSGTRLKVLEAARLRVPIVTTTKGVEGLPFVAGRDLRVADSVPEIVDAVEWILANPDAASTMTSSAATVLDEQLNWDSVVDTLIELLESSALDRSPSAAAR